MKSHSKCENFVSKENKYSPIKSSTLAILRQKQQQQYKNNPSGQNFNLYLLKKVFL